MADDKKKRQEWKQTFDMLDKDKSGGIGLKELKIALKGMGFRASADEVEAVMKEYDVDGTGELEFPEFCDIMSAKEKEAAIADNLGVPQKRSRGGKKKKFHMTEDKVAETRRVFDSFDTDGNGTIDFDELTRALNILGFNKTPAEVTSIMNTYDTNHSGDLSYNEFLTMITAENEQLAGMGDRFKSATHKILMELSKTNFTAAAPVDIENWDTVPIKPPGKPGLQTETTFKGAIAVLGVMQVVMIVLFGVCCEMTLVEHDFTNLYMMYGGVVIMMFFGFGYLMTFLKRYGMGAVGFTMMITCIGIQWGILVEGFCKKLYHTETEPSWTYIEVNLHTVLESLFVCAAILISYGAVIGKTSPLQLIVMTFIEAFFYSVNKVMLCLGVVEFVDAGGTINIHMFGAYFGLAVAWMLGKPTASAEAEGGHVSDLFSLIGTLFLWIYWPSFNAAPLVPESPQQQRAVVNTILCLTFTATSAFLMSSILSSSFKFRPVDIQNATIAGGVAIGAVADFTLNPADVALIGFAAGSLSVFGYSRILEPMEHKLNIHDTCGVHNLHGMPSLLAGLVSVIVTAVKYTRGTDSPPVIDDNGRSQPLDQFIAILFTLSISISSGFVTGWIMSRLRPDSGVEAFSDTPWWDVMDDFGRSFEDSEQELEQRLKSSLLELQQGLKTAEELKELMLRYENMEDNGSYDSDDSDEEDEDVAVKLSNLVPARHKASTMFGAGHAKSSMTTSRHQGGGFTGQTSLNSSIHGGGRAAIAKQNLNSSRHSAGLMNRSQHSNASR